MIPVRSAEGFTFTLNERGPQGSLHQGATEQVLFAIQCLSQPAFLSENTVGRESKPLKDGGDRLSTRLL